MEQNVLRRRSIDGNGLEGGALKGGQELNRREESMCRLVRERPLPYRKQPSERQVLSHGRRGDEDEVPGSVG